MLNKFYASVFILTLSYLLQIIICFSSQRALTIHLKQTKENSMIDFMKNKYSLL